jgi:xanthine dehydrogenase accessory factor
MLRAVVENTARAPVDEIVVVLGCRAQWIAPVLEGLPVKLVINGSYREGQSSSLKAGLSAVDEGAGGIMFILGDQPLVRPETLGLLVERFKERGGITVPFYNGKRGNPVLLERHLLSNPGAIAGDEGARGIIAGNPHLVQRVDVDDEGVLLDVDTWEDYLGLMEPDGGAAFAKKDLVIIKGAGDLASGTAHRLFKCGFQVILLERPDPQAIRRTVSFAQAVFSGVHTVEGVTAVLTEDPAKARGVAGCGRLAVMIDQFGLSIKELMPDVVVDAVMAKKNLGTAMTDAPVVVGLGPGFTAGLDVHAVVETCRGHDLGRVIYSGTALPNTGVPGKIGGHAEERVVRSPGRGMLKAYKSIGDFVEKDEILGLVGGYQVVSPLTGVLRGMLQDGLQVTAGMKIGDLDPRLNRDNCFTISDKSRAVAGGVLEAVMFLKRRKGQF